jgi:hypothetical protein
MKNKCISDKELIRRIENVEASLSPNMPKFSYFKASLNCNTFKVKKIREWVETECLSLHVLNLFGGPTRLLGCIETSNDLQKEYDTTFHMEALECATMFASENAKFDVILLDPPYSYRKSMEYYNKHSAESCWKKLLDIIPKILKPDGKVICFGYHASQMGKLRGFYVDEILVVDHSGAMHSTIACVEKRIK